MKIISKVKDFYDYVVGIYGEDPKMVYDRRMKDQFVFSKYLKENRGWERNRNEEGYEWVNCWVLMGSKVWDFAFRPFIDPTSDPRCPTFKFEWKTPQDLIRENEEWKKKYTYGRDINPRNGEVINREVFLSKLVVRKINQRRGWYDRYKLNEEEKKTPVILMIGRELKFNPILKNTPLESFIPGEECFVAIQDFIGSLKDMSPEDKRNDIQKLESAGFDKKISFRNVK